MSIRTPLRVLVAEDDEPNAWLLRRLLQKWGHSLQLVDDGRDALRHARSGSFDLVLLDLHMPGLDGLEVVRALREDERGSGGHLPVIALTGSSYPADRERCLAAGMDEFVAKPIAASALEAAFRRIAALILAPTTR